MPSGAPSPSPIAAVPASPSIWIIVPTYNECENVGPISGAILATVPQANVLFVDDGSPDGTGELADQLARQHRTSPCCTDRPNRDWDRPTWPPSETCLLAGQTSWSR